MGSRASEKKEISCRITRTLIMYVREMNGSLGNLLDGLELDETYLTDTNNWISHEFLHILYARMTDILGDKNPVYKMALASKRFESLGLLDWIARLLGTPKLIYTQAPKYNRFLKANGDVYIHDSGDSWVVLEDRYHDSSQKTRHDCDYTRGILAGIPTIFDMPLAHVEEVECQVAAEAYGERIWPDQPRYGGRGCLYRVQWEARERPPLWKRIFQRYRVYRKAINDLQEANQAIQEKYDEARKLASDLETVNRKLIESRQQLETYTAELKQSELRYKLLANNVTDTLWTMSLEPLRFTYISPSIERMRGYSVDEAMALPLDETLTPESLERVAKVLEEELIREASGNFDPNRSKTIEIQQCCKDGTSKWAEVTTSFLRDEAGKALGLLGVTRDIADRKRAEQLDQAKIAAEASNAAKSEFLSNMSHELRTPLNHIMGFTELILGKSFGGLSETQEEYLTDIYKSSEHLLSLVNQVLDVSKIEAGKLDLNKSEINLKKILEQCLSFTDKAAARNIRLTTDIDQIPETIIADELRLKQILYNLLSNAVKFTDDGGNICLGARMIAGPERETSAETGSLPSEVEISVVDTGIGIRKEDMDKDFRSLFPAGEYIEPKISGNRFGAQPHPEPGGNAWRQDLGG